LNENENFNQSKLTPPLQLQTSLDQQQQKRRLSMNTTTNKEIINDLNNNDQDKENIYESKDIFDPISISDLRALSSFGDQNEAFHWYLNLLFETSKNCIDTDKTLDADNKSRRLNIAIAHQLYARNFYTIRIANSSRLKYELEGTHALIIVLACLINSDSLRIVESHSCACDSYIHMFSTKVKFCAWKCKFYVLLKRPNRSSIDRLELIEHLTSCHKLIQDRTIN
jgi:hypothetical protein